MTRESRGKSEAPWVSWRPKTDCIESFAIIVVILGFGRGIWLTFYPASSYELVADSPRVPAGRSTKVSRERPVTRP